MAAGSGTGTVAGAASGGVTLTAFLAQVRLYLADVTVWPDLTLIGYVQDAVRFYSIEFPRRGFRSLSLTTGTQVYALWSDVREVVKVEYPAGESPAEYLDRVSLGSLFLGDGEAVYALTAPAYADYDAMADIVFGPAVSTGESAVIHYQGLHAVPTTGTDVLSVPDEHFEALHALVDFRAHWQLETAEALTVTNVAIVLSQLGENARRAWNRYKEITGRLQEQAAIVPAGGMAWLGRDRIY